MRRYLLGIDVGTTGTKTIVFDEEGALLAQAYEGYPLSTPQVGYSEQDPEDLWHAVCSTVRAVCKEPKIAASVVAVSISVQGGTLVPVDKDGTAVCPAIVWNDARCTEQCTAFEHEVGEPSVMYQKTGWKLIPALPALEIRWIKDNRPEVFQRTAKFLTVPDFISLKMTGTAACDLSGAGINQLCDIRRGCYDEQLLRFAGITEDQLPKLVRSGEIIGHLTEKAAAELGLTTSCVLVGGAHDQYAVALGAGAVEAGDILIGSGTCWVITAIGEQADFSSGLSQSVAAVPGKWGSLWSLSSGGVCLDWLRHNLAFGEGGEGLSYTVLDHEAHKRRAAEDGLFFFPFSGRATLEKGFQKASFVGIDLSHDRFDFARAIMEGVAFQIVWMMEAFRTKPSQKGLIFAGGASKSEVWSQILANMAGIPVRIPAVADLACVGAAILAGVGCGIYKTPEQGYRCLAVGERVMEPDSQQSNVYRRLMKEYKQKAAVLGDLYGSDLKIEEAEL